jgi:hypothetical protein
VSIRQSEPAARDGRADFDFLMGSWRVHNRRLKERLKSSEEWEEFDGVSVARPVLGGLGNVDEVTFQRESGPLLGMTVRVFDPAARQWSIYWADSVNGELQTPMVGEFSGGEGRFYDQETFEGRRILSRFIWSRITPTSCQWEQAFSADGGVSWETNWIMEFVRTS